MGVNRKSSLSGLGETEVEVLNIVWELGKATVADVRNEILKSRDVAYTTIMTVMRKLAHKGYLDFEEDGKSYLYSAAVPANKVRGQLLRDLVSKVFRGSGTDLVRTLVDSESLSDDEIRELRSIVETLEADHD